MIHANAARLPIRTPEGVEFPLLLAGPGVRFLALAVDLAAISAITAAADNVVLLVSVLSLGFGEAVKIVLFYLISTGYGILTEWLWRGQTVGKRMLGLRVVDARGGRLHASQLVIRNLLRPVDMLPVFYLLGGIVCLAGSKLQRLGDLAAGTIVVRVEELTVPDLDQLLGSRFNSMAEHRHLAARLRQRTSPDLAAAALDALTRRDQLEPAARLEVFAELAARFRELVTFPPEAVEALPDEQYVRNAVDIVFRAGTKTTGRTRPGSSS